MIFRNFLYLQSVQVPLDGRAEMAALPSLQCTVQPPQFDAICRFDENELFHFFQVTGKDIEKNRSQYRPLLFISCYWPASSAKCKPQSLTSSLLDCPLMHSVIMLVTSILQETVFKTLLKLNLMAFISFLYITNIFHFIIEINKEINPC